MSDWKIRFGTAGTSDSFAAQGYKRSLDVPEYTAKMGLNAFEYQCGRGVRLGLDKAAKMAALAGPKDILFSVHAPYYISMSSLEEEKRLNSIQYLLQSAAVCKALGGRRIIFHSGSCGKQSREAALEKALDTMRRAVEALDEAGFADMTLCPETMGKIGQLGTLDEVLALCSVDKRITPCIDFGHLYARSLGADDGAEAMARMLDRVEQARAILKRSNEINQMMKVIGEEGTSDADYTVYQKGELLDAVYLQQNSFDPIDAACGPDRQRYEFDVLYDVLKRDFRLDDKKEIRAFFNQLRQEFLDWHNTEFRTPEFEAQEKRLKDFYLSKAAL